MPLNKSDNWILLYKGYMSKDVHKALHMKIKQVQIPLWAASSSFFCWFFFLALRSSLHRCITLLVRQKEPSKRIKLIGLFIELSGLYGCRRMCQRKEKKKKRKAALIKTALRYGAVFCPSPSHRLRRPRAPSARCYSEHCCFSTSTEISAPTQVSAPRSTRAKFSPLFWKAARSWLLNRTYNGGCLKGTMMPGETGVHPRSSNMWVLQWKHACRCARRRLYWCRFVFFFFVQLSVEAHLHRYAGSSVEWPAVGLRDAPPASCLVCTGRVKEWQTCPVMQQLCEQAGVGEWWWGGGTFLSPCCSLQCRRRSRLFLCGHIKRPQWKRCGIYSERWQELRCSLATLWCFCFISFFFSCTSSPSCVFAFPQTSSSFPFYRAWGSGTCFIKHRFKTASASCYWGTKWIISHRLETFHATFMVSQKLMSVCSLLRDTYIILSQRKDVEQKWNDSNKEGKYW